MRSQCGDITVCFMGSLWRADPKRSQDEEGTLFFLPFVCVSRREMVILHVSQTSTRTPWTYTAQQGVWQLGKTRGKC